jgi:hypothetical protein
MSSQSLRRKSLNSASLLGLKHAERYCTCARPGRPAYNEHGDRVGFFCEKHLREGGYCIVCGDTRTAKEIEERMDGWCSKHDNMSSVPF